MTQIKWSISRKTQTTKMESRKNRQSEQIYNSAEIKLVIIILKTTTCKKAADGFNDEFYQKFLQF